MGILPLSEGQGLLKELVEVDPCFCGAGNISYKERGCNGSDGFLCVVCTFSPHKFIQDEYLIQLYFII